MALGLSYCGVQWFPACGITASSAWGPQRLIQGHPSSTAVELVLQRASLWCWNSKACGTVEPRQLECTAKARRGGRKSYRHVTWTGAFDWCPLPIWRRLDVSTMMAHCGWSCTGRILGNMVAQHTEHIPVLGSVSFPGDVPSRCEALGRRP